MGADAAGGKCPRWEPGCPLPRILCIVTALPFEVGPKLFGAHPAGDAGCSVVWMMRIRPRTLLELQSPDPLRPSVRLLKEFIDKGVTDLPMPNGGVATAGLLKGISQCTNVPDHLHKVP